MTPELYAHETPFIPAQCDSDDGILDQSLYQIVMRRK
jgi:hypothetical protein